MDQQVAVVVTKPICVRLRTAAELADVSMATIYLWVRQGKLKTVKVGADQRVLVEELEKFLRDGRGATSAK